MSDATNDTRWDRQVNRAPRRLDAAEIERIVGLAIENSEGFEAVDGLSTLDVIGDRCVVFRDRFDANDIAAVDAFAGRSALFLLPPEYRGKVRVPAIFVDRPREAFILLAAALYDYFGTYWRGFEDAGAAQARHREAIVMPGCFIHPEARIGPGTMVFPGCVIGPRVTIGRQTLIKPNTVIGAWGFGIYTDAARTNLHLPHVGGVVIGDDVEIGALCTVCAGTVHPTLLADNVKIDDHVHVAHNVQVGRSTQITACAELSGSVTIAERSFLGPNCSVSNGAKIGSDTIVGIGAAVLKDVSDRTLVVGNPARLLRELPG